MDQKSRQANRATSNRTGYTAFYTNTTAYALDGAGPSWSLIPAVRHAMTLYPHSTYFFSLSPHALIMNPSLALTTHLLAPARLERLMLKDIPVVPPDSVIRTFGHLRGDKIDLVLTQDTETLCAGSFVVRQGEWARFFLDSWFDPLYRSYNFQKAEGHALVLSSIVTLQADAATREKGADGSAGTGTRRAMAPYHPDQTRPRPAARHERLQYPLHSPAGERCVRGRRFPRSISRLQRGCDQGL